MSDNKPTIEFVTKIPSLSVVLDRGGMKTDPTTGTVLEAMPPRLAEFRDGTFLPKTEADAVTLLRIFSESVARGENPTFTYSHRSASGAEALAAAKGIRLQATRLSNGNAPLRAVGESVMHAGAKPGEQRNAGGVIRAEDVERAEAEKARQNAGSAQEASEGTSGASAEAPAAPETAVPPEGTGKSGKTTKRGKPKPPSA